MQYWYGRSPEWPHEKKLTLGEQFWREISVICERFGLVPEGDDSFVNQGVFPLVPHIVPIPDGLPVRVFVGVDKLMWEIDSTYEVLSFWIHTYVFESKRENRPGEEICNVILKVAFAKNHPASKPTLSIVNIDKIRHTAKNAKALTFLNPATSGVLCVMADGEDWNPDKDDVRRAVEVFVGWLILNDQRGNVRRSSYALPG